jgi:putative two-component system response regulator
MTSRANTLHRVGELAARVAAGIGLPGDEVELIRVAAPLHNVGKIGISYNILLKPGPLTTDEFEVIKTHTTIGAEILSGSQVPLLILAREIALTHHEQWDGRGYPRGYERKPSLCLGASSQSRTRTIA